MDSEGTRTFTSRDIQSLAVRSAVLNEIGTLVRREEACTTVTLLAVSIASYARRGIIGCEMLTEVQKLSEVAMDMREAAALIGALRALGGDEKRELLLEKRFPGSPRLAGVMEVLAA